MPSRKMNKRLASVKGAREHHRRLLFVETLETRRLLASVPFSMTTDIANTADGAASAFVADLDGDGDADVLSASSHDDTIAWYENVDGAGTFVLGQTVDNTADGAASARAADIDGDGDLDLLAASADEDTIAWYDNTNGMGLFGGPQTITTTADGARDVWPVDIDRDGDLDVLAASSLDNTIGWFENTDGAGTFGVRQTITSTAAGANAVFPADLDNDGDMDVLAASATNNTVAWYENTNGAGSFGPAQTITDTAQAASSVHAADLDHDGDLDVLSSSYDDDTIAWYENTDGQGAFGTPQAITTSADGASSVFAQDLDADGDTDILATSARDDTIAWFENTDGAGNFAPGVAVSSTADGAVFAMAIDLDSDGDTDVLGASRDDDTLAWHRNETIHRGAAFFDPGIGIIGPNDFGSRSVSLADVDGDGDLDALYGVTYDSILMWAENTDGAGTFALHDIDTSTAGPASVELADVDRDGDVDAVVAFVDADTIAWYENTDGAGTFGSKQTIGTTQDNPAAVHTVDLDSDGDLDVLAASFDDDTVAWYENLNSAGNFGSAQVITDMADGAIAVHAADIDGDGDADVMTASFYDDTIAWYENTNGTGTFGAKNVITDMADAAISVSAADLDGDGDLDLLAASAFDDTVAWYENLDGQGTFGPEQLLASNADGASWVSTADVDLDGDPDVIWSAFVGGDLAWNENLDGAGTFAVPRFVSTLSPNVNAFDVGDIDGDGDLDIIPAIYATTTTVWYENRGGQVALPTSDTALPTIVEGRAEDVLRIDMVHRGRAGDHDEELVSLALLLEEDEDDPLTSAEANALIDGLDIYRDDGSGAFEADTDTLVTSVDTLDLTGGLETISFADGDPNAQVSFGAPAIFFVVARLTPDATEQPVNQFRVTHVMEGPTGSTAEDADADIPITIELPQNVTSMIVGAGLLGDMDRDGDRDLDDVNGFVLGLTDAQAYEDQHGLPSSVHGDIDGDGDHDLDDVDPFVILLTGGQGGQAESGGGAASQGGGAASRPEQTAGVGSTDESPTVARSGQGSVQASPDASRTARRGRPMAGMRSGELVVADNAAERSHEARRPAAVLAGTRFARRQASTDVELAAVWRPDEDWLRRGFL